MIEHITVYILLFIVGVIHGYYGYNIIRNTSLVELVYTVQYESKEDIIRNEE